jgi:hypothetical protein
MEIFAIIAGAIAGLVALYGVVRLAVRHALYDVRERDAHSNAPTAAENSPA